MSKQTSAIDSPVEEKEQDESAEPAEKTRGIAAAMVQEMLEGIEDEGRPIIKLVDAILFGAVRTGATDIHIEPFEKKSHLRYRIDGRLREIDSIRIPESRHNAIVSRIKIMAGMDIAERRLPQDGVIKFNAEGKEYGCRVATFPSIHGESVTLRLVDRSHKLPALPELGFAPETLKAFQNVISQPYGLILVTGPTGSGKTTTLYAALNEINTPSVKVFTIENAIELEMPGAIQGAIKPQIGLSFASMLRSVLRHDPDIILVGELRSKETFDLAVEAALTGHLVLSTLHANDAPASLVRPLELGVEPVLVAGAISAVLAQRLVRRICSQCREAVEPTDEMLKELEAARVDTRDLQIYKGIGCHVCGGTGFKGRTAIHELLVMNDELRKLVEQQASAQEIFSAARKAGMKTLWEDGMEKVALGVTTFEEAILKTSG